MTKNRRGQNASNSGLTGENLIQQIILNTFPECTCVLESEIDKLSDKQKKNGLLLRQVQYTKLERRDGGKRDFRLIVPKYNIDIFIEVKNQTTNGSCTEKLTYAAENLFVHNKSSILVLTGKHQGTMIGHIRKVLDNKDYITSSYLRTMTNIPIKDNILRKLLVGRREFTKHITSLKVA